MLTSLAYVGLACSLYMTGIVWFAQGVHYPLLNRAADFLEFANDYQRRTFYVVFPGLVWRNHQCHRAAVVLAFASNVDGSKFTCGDLDAHLRLPDSPAQTFEKWLL